MIQILVDKTPGWVILPGLSVLNTHCNISFKFAVQKFAQKKKCCIFELLMKNKHKNTKTMTTQQKLEKKGYTVIHDMSGKVLAKKDGRTYSADNITQLHKIIFGK